LVSNLIDFPLWYVNFLLAVTFHEAAHAWAAYKMGDSTAYEGGQVTINPKPHIQREPVGMVVLPIITFIQYGYCLGWASAPYNAGWRRTYPKRAGLMALAGPSANLALALFFGVILSLLVNTGFAQIDYFSDNLMSVSSRYFFFSALVDFLQIAIQLNVILLSFNLLPFPPLDGYGILGLIVSKKMSLKLFKFSSHPNAQMGGLLIAFLSFGYVFSPVWSLTMWFFVNSLQL
jgi:Zn-dependent protease